MKYIYLTAAIIITGLMVLAITMISITFFGDPAKMVLFLVLTVIIYQVLFTPVVVLYLRKKRSKS
ncbi:hypothetical protein [Lentilactobacillus sp. SPB1-3]|uniref:Uncharacterized protein n=1 Tax=Lentilactobacillus terminaliae TaxID=3003483 RepID=A0ACD5DGM8_9LACO|nr:hypothetical protein [Lentilactobacillus sp. SPB1-3]MCZ0977024.1 hypothetical protein [Lentilactobacillus sp. SPB1-3]